MMTRAMFERFAIAVLILSFLFFGMLASGMIRPAKSQVSFQMFQKPSIIIIGNGTGENPMVEIKPSGEIIYGKDYTPDKAAKAFWDAAKAII